MYFFAILMTLSFLVSTHVEAKKNVFDRYDTKAEVPEPLVFDLVRRINSRKGEFEINTLVMQQNTGDFNELHYAPELEFAVADGVAIEAELPMVGGRVFSYKAALQFQTPAIFGNIDGVQILWEKEKDRSITEWTPLYLIAKRWSERWSSISMIGNRFLTGDDSSIRNRRMREYPIINSTVFYNMSDILDLGLEVNLRGMGASFEEVLIMPQMHALFAGDFKVQAGFGLAHDGYRAYPASAFRFIKEYN